MPKSHDILTPKVTIALVHDGKHRILQRGRTLVRVGHPLAEAFPKLFEPVHVHYDIDATTETRAGAAKSRHTKSAEAEIR